MEQSDNVSIPIILEPQPEGGFLVRVPALPEVVTEGETEAEALAMAEDAIKLALVERDAQKGGGFGVSPLVPTVHVLTVAV